MKTQAVVAGCLALAASAFGGLTLDEDFGEEGKAIGSADSGWSRPAAALVGQNRGSYFFDVSFDEGLQPLNGMRTVATLRTKSRLSIGWISHANREFTGTDPGNSNSGRSRVVS